MSCARDKPTKLVEDRLEDTRVVAGDAGDAGRLGEGLRVLQEPVQRLGGLRRKQSVRSLPHESDVADLVVDDGAGHEVGDLGRRTVGRLSGEDRAHELQLVHRFVLLDGDVDPADGEQALVEQSDDLPTKARRLVGACPTR